MEVQSSTTAATGVQSAAPPATPAQPAITVGQRAVLLLNLTPPFQQTITMGQCPAPPKPPAQLNCTSDQHPAPPDPPVQPTTPVVHPSTLTDSTFNSSNIQNSTENNKISNVQPILKLKKSN